MHNQLSSQVDVSYCLITVFITYIRQIQDKNTKFFKTFTVHNMSHYISYKFANNFPAKQYC